MSEEIKENATVIKRPKTIVEGQMVEELDHDKIGKCFTVNLELTVSNRALEMIGEHNPMRNHQVGLVNLMAGAIMTKAQEIIATGYQDTTYGKDPLVKNQAAVVYNTRLEHAKREASIAITELEKAVLFLGKALVRLA